MARNEHLPTISARVAFEGRALPLAEASHGAWLADGGWDALDPLESDTHARAVRGWCMDKPECHEPGHVEQGRPRDWARIGPNGC